MADVSIWRLSREPFASSAFSGEGARQHGGRFNSQGTAVVYGSESLAQILVETLTSQERYDQLRCYVFFRARLSEKIISELPKTDFPEGWDRHPPPSEAQRLGNQWERQEKSVALRVPSVVVPYSYNYLLTPAHSAFNEVEIGTAETFPVDPRLIPRG